MAEPGAREDLSGKIFVGGLHRDGTEDEFATYFKAFGEITGVCMRASCSSGPAAYMSTYINGEPSGSFVVKEGPHSSLLSSPLFSSMYLLQTRL